MHFKALGNRKNNVYI